MNIRLTTLAAAILAGYTLPGLAQSDPFIEKILNEHYPENAAATAEYRHDLVENRRREGVDKDIVCHYHEITDKALQSDSDGDRFCMHFHSEKPSKAHRANAATFSLPARESYARSISWADLSA